MLAFAPNTPATLSIPLLDANGLPLTADAVSYQVTDQSGAERVPLTVLALPDGPADTVELTLPGAINGLAVGASRELRVVTLSITTETGPATVVYRYLVKAEDALGVMKNSFQTFSQALLLGTEMVNMEAWDAASDDRKQAALADAYRAICKLRFDWGFDNDQTRLNDIRWTPHDMDKLNEAQFMNLDERFRSALCRAQVIEANARLGGTDVSDLRREGLMSATVGEVSQMFRPSKPLVLPISHRALQVLAGYITWSVRASR